MHLLGGASNLTDNLKSLDDQWAECFARLEAMLLAKSLAVPGLNKQKSSPVRSHSLILVPVQARSLLGLGCDGYRFQPCESYHAC